MLAALAVLCVFGSTMALSHHVIDEHAPQAGASGPGAPAAPDAASRAAAGDARGGLQSRLFALEQRQKLIDSSIAAVRLARARRRGLARAQRRGAELRLAVRGRRRARLRPPAAAAAPPPPRRRGRAARRQLGGARAAAAAAALSGVSGGRARPVIMSPAPDDWFLTGECAPMNVSAALARA